MTSNLLTQAQPGHYGDPAAEYAALLEGVALVGRSSAGRVRVGGADGLDLLDRLSTNKMAALAAGEGAPTVVTTNKGRVVDLLLVTVRSDHLLYLTSPGRQSAVMEWLDFYTFSEDVAVKDLTETTALFVLAGPRAKALLESVGAPVGGLPRFHSREVVAAGVEALVWHTLGAGAETYELLAPRTEASRLWDGLRAAGAIPVGQEAWEACRVARGVPVYGAEFGEDTNPLESGLKGAISFNKGCYVGQEVVARLDTYRKVQRRLMAAVLSGPAKVGDALLALRPPESDLIAPPGAGQAPAGAGQAGERKVGKLTSVARVPAGGAYVALALVRSEHAVDGAALAVVPGDVTATLSTPAYALATEPAEA